MVRVCSRCFKSGLSVETHLVMSSAARTTIEYEMERDPAEIAALADIVYDERNVGAAIASGSFVTDGMIVAPCSMRTLSRAIANSLDDTLLTRAADVCLKERRRLVLIARETPLHRPGHLRLMLDCTNARGSDPAAIPGLLPSP